VDVAHRHARLRQSTHLRRGSPSVLTSPSPAGIAKNQTTHGRFLYFWLLYQKCKASADKGKRSNKNWGRNVAKRRNELSPPFQRRGTVGGTGAAKRQHELLAAKPPMFAPTRALGWSGSWPGRPLHAAASRRGFAVLGDPPLKRRASAPESARGQGGESPPQAYALRPETEGNCVVATRGGEQPEVNDSSVR